MSGDPKLSLAVQQTLTDLLPVIADLQAWPGYGPAQSAAVGTLTAFQQALLDYQAASDSSPEAIKALRDNAQQTISPLLAQLIDTNLGILNMGPLNTAKVLSNDAAKAYNARLGGLQNDVFALVAAANAALSPPPPQAKLVRLDVQGASAAGGGYQATYSADPAAFVAVTAVVDPDTEENRRLVAWKGGEADPGRPDRRRVPRNALTPENAPVALSATLLGGTGQFAAKIAVIPEVVELAVPFLGFKVTATQWYAYVGSRPARVQATTNPATPEVWKALAWSGTDGPGLAPNQQEVALASARAVALKASLPGGSSKEIQLQIKAV
jgi:hypothetical protein